MHEIHQYIDPHPMASVHELFKVIRIPKPRRNRKEIRDMIPETAVISVLHQRHDLHGVVPKFLNPGQHIILELFERVHAFLNPAHPNMHFVNPQRTWLLRVLVLENIRCGGVPERSIKAFVGGILMCEANPRRNLVNPLVIWPLHMDFHLRIVRDRELALSMRKKQFPIAEFIAFARELRTVPAIELSKKEHLLRSWQPLSVKDTIGLHDKAVVLVTSRKFYQR